MMKPMTMAALALACMATTSLAETAPASKAEKMASCKKELGDGKSALCEMLYGDQAPANALLFLGLAQTHAAQGDTDAALAAYTRVIEIDPAMTGGWDGRAQLYFTKLNQPEKAIADYEAGIAAVDTDDKKKWLDDRLMAIKQKMSE